MCIQCLTSEMKEEFKPEDRPTVEENAEGRVIMTMTPEQAANLLMNLILGKAAIQTLGDMGRAGRA